MLTVYMYMRKSLRLTYRGVMREMRMSVRRKSLVRIQWLWGR